MMLAALLVLTSVSQEAVRPWLRFEPNHGQAGPAVLYVGRGAGIQVLVGRSGVSILPAAGSMVSLELVGGDASAVYGDCPLPGTSNYIVGCNPSAWVTGIPGYAEVRMECVYPGVDVILRTSGQSLEYDVVVASRQALEPVRLRLQGGRVHDLGDGSLVVPTPRGFLRQLAPVVRDAAGHGSIARLDRCDDGTLQVSVDAETSFPLLVDPVLSWSTYYGGRRDDAIEAVAVDAAGDVYVAGRTLSENLPLSNPVQGTYGGGDGYDDGDAFVAKLDAGGTQLLWATYLGGALGDAASGLAVDGLGRVWLAGVTSSEDFPTASPIQSTLGGGAGDGFVAVLSPSGASLAYATYLGGRGDDAAAAVAVDATGSAYVTGYTASGDFPTVSAWQPAKSGYVDAFLAGVAAGGGPLAFSTFLGGTDDDRGVDVDVDPAGAIHVLGTTRSDNFPTLQPLQAARNGEEDAFVTAFQPGGLALRHSTYYGGRQREFPESLAVDASGQAAFVGSTYSDDLPLWNPLRSTFDGSEAFVAKLDGAGSGLIFATYLGGDGYESARSVAVDPGAVYVAGETQSTDFPLAAPVFDTRLGWDDAFVTVLDPLGQQYLFSTYLGGTDYDWAEAIATDGQGAIVVAGSTYSVDFPTQDPLQPAHGDYLAYGDGFVARLAPGSLATVASFTGTPILGAPPPMTVQFTDLSAGGPTSWLWSFGDGATSTLQDPGHTYTSYGRYDVSLTVAGPLGADAQARPGFVEVPLPPQSDFVGSPREGAPPLAVSFTSLGNATYYPSWQFGDGSYDYALDPVHVYTSVGTYTVSHSVSNGIDSDGEVKQAYIDVYVVKADFAGTPRIGRPPLTVQFQDRSRGSVQFRSWDFGDGGTSMAGNPSHTYGSAGRYDVSLAVSGAGYVDTEWRASYVLVTPLPTASIAVAPGADPAAAPLVRGYDVLGTTQAGTSFTAYGTSGHGANVGIADLDGAGLAEVLTGPGPGVAYGPQVRAFTATSQPVGRVNYYAYGTLRYGVIVAGGDIDGDAPDEILTGAPPGSVFGPHVRLWNDDGAGVAALAGGSFHAYATLKHGVDVSAASIEGVAREEILTGPGPGPTFAPVVRGFRYAPPVQAIGRVSFQALALPRFGVRVGASDVDADGVAEILAGAGPGPALAPAIRGYAVGPTSVTPVPGLDFEAFRGVYGAEPNGGDLDGDGKGEVLVTRGPDPGAAGEAIGFDYEGSSATPLPSLGIVPFATFGLHAATGALGF